jgi:hypothetical protein
MDNKQRFNIDIEAFSEVGHQIKVNDEDSEDHKWKT